MLERTCPECGSSLGARATYCGCGWGKPPKRGRARDEIDIAAIPDRCEYTNGVVRCRYPAVISQSTRGGGPWYCRHHARPDHPLTMASIVTESQEFKPPTIADDEATFQAEIDASLAKFGLTRQPNESAHAHAMRCREWCLAKVRAGAIKPDKTPDRAWALRPHSQKAVDLMFSAPAMTAEIEAATLAGYIVGDRWIPPGERGPVAKEPEPEPEIELEPGSNG